MVHLGSFCICQYHMLFLHYETFTQPIVQQGLWQGVYCVKILPIPHAVFVLWNIYPAYCTAGYLTGVYSVKILPIPHAVFALRNIYPAYCTAGSLTGGIQYEDSLFRSGIQYSSYADLTVHQRATLSIEEWNGDVVIGSAPDFWGRGPGLKSGIFHNGPDALQDHCEIM